MTSESLYSGALQKALADYKQRNAVALRAIVVPQVAENASIDVLMRLEKALQEQLSKVSRIVVPPMTFDAQRIIEEYYANLDAQSSKQRSDAINQADSAIAARKQKHAAEVEDAKRYNADLLLPYKKKHEELLAYKDQLMHVFQRYDITPLDINIADDITPTEFAALIEKSIAVCKKYIKETNNSVFDKIAGPLKGEKNIQFTGPYVAVLLVGAYIALPLVAVPMFFKMYKSIDNMYLDLEGLRIAYALMSQIDYNRFVKEDDLKVVEDVDFTDIEIMKQEQLSSVKDYSEEKAKALEQLQADNANIQQMLKVTHAECKANVDSLQFELNKVLKNVQKRIAEYMESYKQFPHSISNSAVFNRNFVTTRVEGRIDVTETVPMCNLQFNFKNRDEAISTIKLYLANALCNVQVKTLIVDIVDPKDMCSEFTEFFSAENRDYIRPNSITIDKLISELRSYTQENVIRLDGQDIDTFNTQAEEKEMITLNYRIVILLSEYEDLLDPESEDTDTLRQFLSYSAKYGVQLWLLSNMKLDGVYVVNENHSNKPGAIKYSREMGSQVRSIYDVTLDKFRPKALDYTTKFADKYIPRDKWWTYDTISGADLHFGLQNGNPSLGFPIVLGDANVHAVMGGATGAGKSAAINQMIISLITKYPPSELMMVFVDFKNVEAAKFTRGYERDKNAWMDPAKQEELLKREEYFTRLSTIPHMKIISGTTDGEYALSVFEFLMAEMARRQKIINKAGVTKLENLRKNILKNYCELKGKKCSWYEMRQDWEWYKPNVYDVYGDLPRLIVIMDEFQVMFNPEFVDNKTISKIQSMITAVAKLARAMSCHLWFTSQSMKGTMSKDTLANFSVRAALRCTADVSTELLGNPAAGTITQKFGYIYTNCSAGENPADNKLWKVPFLSDDGIYQYIDEVRKLLKPHNEKSYMAEFYDEKLLIPAEEMDIWYNNYPKNFKDARTFILGNRANYSTNKAPLTTILVDDTNENVCCAAFDKQDMMNLGMTFIRNIKQSDDAILMINAQDQDTYDVMELEKYCDPRFLDLSTPRQNVLEFVDALDGLVQGRKSKSGPFVPVYVLLVQWERAPGISTSPNYKKQDLFKEILREAPTVGIHFILLCKEKGELQRAVVNACNHRIVGKLTNKESSMFSMESKCEKLPDAAKNAGLFALYEYGTDSKKFCLYQSTFSREAVSREVII